MTKEVKYFKNLENSSIKEFLEKESLTDEDELIKYFIDNLKFLFIVNETIVVDYIGPKEKLKIFSKSFIKNIENLTLFLNKQFSKQNIIVNKVVTLKQIGGLEKIKEKWIMYLLSLKEVSGIEIVIKK